jgi:hypothetical protein
VPERDRRLADARASASSVSPSKSGSAPATTNSCGTPAARSAAPEAAELDRMVDELVVVGGDERCAARPAAARASSRLPSRREAGERERVRLALAALDAQAHAGAVEEAARRRGNAARTESRRRRPVAHDELGVGRARDASVALSSCSTRHRPARLLGAQRRQVARELAHQVAARNPHRQAERCVGAGRSMRSSTANVWLAGRRRRRGSGSCPGLSPCRIAARMGQDRVLRPPAAAITNDGKAMDALLLARMQFAANITFHILFPTISIGLGWVLLFMRLRWLSTDGRAGSTRTASGPRCSP